MLVALTALAAILGVAIASAFATAEAETRVGVSSVVVEPLVVPSERIAAGQRLGNDGPRVVDAVGTGVAAKADVGLSARGLVPATGTRIRPAGIPDGWRVTGTNSPGGVLYRDPTNAGNSVRVMQGNPNSPFPNSQAPYVRWQKNGQPLDQLGNQLPSAKVPEAHIPLNDFRFLPGVFG
ncbi:MAG: hypothetical protein ACRCXL_16280 [Dermatophilaceae bacterium]